MEKVTRSNKKRKSVSDQKKEEYQNKAAEIRKKISIASAELERLRPNRKLTKKGKKNRKVLLEECKVISSAELVNYIERSKSQLKKLRRNYLRKKKKHQARSINRQFNEDARSVYTKFSEFCEVAEDRPKYVSDKINGGEINELSDTFVHIVQASRFWMDLWETSGTGTEDPKWLQPIKDAIARKVPPPSEETWDLDPQQAVKILSKKRNWRAPGQDKLVNFWWKRANVIHKDVVKAFKSISESIDYPAWFSERKTRLIPKPGGFTSETSDLLHV